MTSPPQPLPPRLDPTLVDLWIDGRVYRVGPEVRATFQTLHASLNHLARVLEQRDAA